MKKRLMWTVASIPPGKPDEIIMGMIYTSLVDARKRRDELDEAEGKLDKHAYWYFKVMPVSVELMEGYDE